MSEYQSPTDDQIEQLAVDKGGRSCGPDFFQGFSEGYRAAEARLGAREAMKDAPAEMQAVARVELISSNTVGIEFLDGVKTPPEGTLLYQLPNEESPGP